MGTLLVVRLDEGDRLVSGYTLCRHQAIFLESWTDRVVVGHHTDVRRHHWYIFNLVSKLFQRLCIHGQSTDKVDGVGSLTLTKRTKIIFVRKLDQISHLRDTLCKLKSGAEKREQSSTVGGQGWKQTSKHLIVA